jgi:hypothetical protein
LDRTRCAARGWPRIPGRQGHRSVHAGPAKAKNLFAGHTVYSVVLEVPDSELLSEAGASRRMGVWALATLATDAGGWRSINRVGLPMIHPLFTQYNEDLGNRLNAGRPSGDFATYGETVIKAITGVVTANGTAGDPRSYAERVAHRLFPNMLPYTVGTAAAFGFAEWNGRCREPPWRSRIAADTNTVMFKVKDYRLDGAARFKTITLATGEVIRRFLMHVLPKGFHRTRHGACPGLDPGACLPTADARTISPKRASCSLRL